MELDDRARDIKVKGDVNIKGEPFVTKNNINFYKTVPYGQLTLEECEDLFRQRLEALTIIEKADLHKDDVSHLFRGIKSSVYKTNCIILNIKDEQQRRQDHYSHMLARLYCVYHSGLCDWFKACEKKLLLFRLNDHMVSLSGKQIEMILRSFNFNFERVTPAEINKLQKEGLVGWRGRDSFHGCENVDIFRVKWTDALKFVAKRSVSLRAGFAYLTRVEIVSVVCDAFERHLNGELKYARQHLDLGLHRTHLLMDLLNIVYLGHQKIEEDKRQSKRDNSATRNPYTIDINNLEPDVKQHYPPCMRYMHEALVKDSHLKHQARLYYGAFLRSGGVDMDSAIEFWRREFTKKIADDKFERDYKYNIRHLYGREGHKKALSCFSCDKIINDNAPGPSEKHGCPFKHLDDTHLKGMLSDHGLKSVDIESIVRVKNNKEHKKACLDYFRYSKGDAPPEPFKNPIHFYFASKDFANRPQQVQGPEDTFDEEMDMEKVNEALEVVNK